MCGILGGFSVRPIWHSTSVAALRGARDRLAHRGPDSAAEYVAEDGRSFLAHRRLSIIDIAGGEQPLCQPSSARRLIYNGEIYNHSQLRTELQAAGCQFRSRSDGEPALHGLALHGPRYLSRLRGMFALALLDTPANSLLLARDRLGIKPLYYWCDGQHLLFASELKGLLPLLPASPAISASALAAYLSWKYIPAPLTIYAGVRELEPGTCLQVSADSSGNQLQLQHSVWWSPDSSRVSRHDEAAALAELEPVVDEAVQVHLESDVEVGALLSGGVDSSLVVSMAQRHCRTPIRTFAVGFSEDGFDQLPFARRLAEHCGTRHHELTASLAPIQTVDRLVDCFDQPYADSSALASLAVCQVAAQHVKVVLTGDGGDEIFAGYQRYRALADATSRRPFDQLVRRVAFNAASAFLSPEAKPLRRIRYSWLPPLEEFEQRERLGSNWLLRRLLPDHLLRPGRVDPLTERRVALLDSWPLDRSLVAAAQQLDMATYLPGDILAKVDRTSMACSLECRPPLLDHHVVEFAQTLADSLKLRGGGKFLLKRLAERHVPAELIYRKKRGFRVPIRRWFKGELAQPTQDLLLNGVAVKSGLLRANGVRWLLSAQRRPWINLASMLWALLMLELWARRQPAATLTNVVVD